MKTLITSLIAAAVSAALAIEAHALAIADSAATAATVESNSAAKGDLLPMAGGWAQAVTPGVTTIAVITEVGASTAVRVPLLLVSAQ